jgi:protein TonB
MTQRDTEPESLNESSSSAGASSSTSGKHLRLIREGEGQGSNALAPGPTSIVIELYGRRQSNAPLGLALIAAFALHGACGTITRTIATPKRLEERVKMEMYKPPPPPPPEPEVKEEKPKPKKKKPKKKKPKKVEPPPPSNQDPPPEPPKKPPPRVTGISMKSIAKGKSGFKVRVGNTAYGDLNKEKFVSADQVKGYGGGSREFKPVRKAQVSRQAKPIRKYKPRYPRALVDEGIEGRVLLEVEITRAGKVRKVTILKRLHPLLDKKSIMAVRKTIFRPAQVNGKNVDSKTTYTVTWKLD